MTSYARQCDGQRQICPNPRRCGDGCEFDNAELTTRNGGQRVDDGMPVQMFEPVERATDRALRYAEAAVDWLCEAAWKVGTVALVGAAAGFSLLVIWYVAQAYITWRGI